jgi:hypothetical protein
MTFGGAFLPLESISVQFDVQKKRGSRLKGSRVGKLGLS